MVWLLAPSTTPATQDVDPGTPGSLHFFQSQELNSYISFLQQRSERKTALLV